MDSGYRVRTNEGIKLESVSLEELAKMLAQGAIDIDTPIKDQISGKIFFPDQHPRLRASLNSADLALRETVSPTPVSDLTAPTLLYQNLRNALITTFWGVLVVIAIVLMLYRSPL